MKSPSPTSVKISAIGPFANVAPTAAEHFRLAIFGAIAHLIEAATRCERDAVLAAHPFLATYANEIAARLQRPAASAAQWRQALASWEAGLAANLPLLALTAAGFGPLEIELLMAVGVPEEDRKRGLGLAGGRGGEAQEGEEGAGHVGPRVSTVAGASVKCRRVGSVCPSFTKPHFA